MEDIRAKLESKTFYSPDGCWYFTGPVNRGGYGHERIDGKRYLTHRLSYQINKGEIPDKMWVLHSCDNTRCINPDHLRLGTNIDNVGDKVKRNRQAKGERIGRGKFTSNQILVIREAANSGFKQKDIAIYFCTGEQTISLIVNKKRWKHL